MQSLIRSNQFLSRNKTLIVYQLKRWIRFEPLVIDKPPDYYRTIEKKLNEINYYETASHLKDIGFDKDSDVRQKWSEVRKAIELKTKAIEESDDLGEEEEKKSLNYKRIYEKWLLSEVGITSTIEAANHYAIFRDLFPVTAQPHSISATEAMPSKPIYYFSPLVPLKAEFCVNESEIAEQMSSEEVLKSESNDVIVSPVFRGNLLFPEKCINCPNVTIDSSAINGINNTDNAEEGEELAEEISGRIRLLNDDTNYYTLALISLDSHFGDESNVCHWLTTNIHNKNKTTNSETIVKYLPVYGVRGLGYHRFVFILYKHSNRLNLESINDFDLKKRRFNAFEFMTAHGSDNCLTPIGLSWFQTTWDYSSQNIFYNYLDMRSPHYEWIPPKDDYFKQLQFPARAPFNIYLDRFRDPKDLAKDVLLERLKSINPYEYDNIFDKPVLPHIHQIPMGTPDWLKASIRKRRTQHGIYRGLRPHSAIEPLNNNADLDRPKWPRIHESIHPLNQPIPYPDGHRRPKALKDTLWAKPPHEHPTYRVAYQENLDSEDTQKLRKSE